MTRNLKALGVALAAVFALGALMASSASAISPGKLTAPAPFTLTGTETGVPLDNSLTHAGSSIRCPGSTYHGGKINITPHQLSASPATEVTIIPTYKNCTDQEGHPMTIAMNGCDYRFHSLTSTATVHTYSVKTDVVCPPGATIIVTVFEIRHATGAHTNKLCEITIEHNEVNKTGLHITNTTGGTDDIGIKGTITGIKTITHGLCVFFSTPTRTDDVLHIDATFKADNSVGTPINLTATH
jgi:hypothetical protein